MRIGPVILEPTRAMLVELIQVGPKIVEPMKIEPLIADLSR